MIHGQQSEKWPRRIGHLDNVISASMATEVAADQEQKAMRRPRRNHTAALKSKVATAALKDDETLLL